MEAKGGAASDRKDIEQNWHTIADLLTGVAAAKSEKDYFLDWQKHRNNAVALLEQTSRIFAAQYADDSTLRVAETLLGRFKMYDDQCTLLVADAERSLKNLGRVVPRLKGSFMWASDSVREIQYDIQLLVKAYTKDLRLLDKILADLTAAEKVMEDAEEKIPCGSKMKFENVKIVSVHGPSASSSAKDPLALPAPSSVSTSSVASSSAAVTAPPSLSAAADATSASFLASPTATASESSSPRQSIKQSKQDIKSTILEAGAVVCVLAVDQGLAVVLLTGGITTQKIGFGAKHSLPFLIANSEVQALLQQYANEFRQCHRFAHGRQKQLKQDMEKLEQLAQQLNSVLAMSAAAASNAAAASSAAAASVVPGASPSAPSSTATTTTASPPNSGVASSAITELFDTSIARIAELTALYADFLTNKREIVIGTPNTDPYVRAALKDPSVQHLLHVAHNSVGLRALADTTPDSPVSDE